MGACISRVSGKDCDKDAIAALLQQFEDGLNDGDAEKEAGCFAPDAVIMAAGYDPVIGMDDIRGVYAYLFSATEFRCTFTIQEIILLCPGWAVLRTVMNESSMEKESGEKGTSYNQELFVLNKLNGEWKIARYAFNTIRSPA